MLQIQPHTCTYKRCFSCISYRGGSGGRCYVHFDHHDKSPMLTRVRLAGRLSSPLCRHFAGSARSVMRQKRNNDNKSETSRRVSAGKAAQTMCVNAPLLDTGWSFAFLLRLPAPFSLSLSLARSLSLSLSRWMCVCGERAHTWIHVHAHTLGDAFTHAQRGSGPIMMATQTGLYCLNISASTPLSSQARHWLRYCAFFKTVQRMCTGCRCFLANSGVVCTISE